ncbi:MAG: tRNA adenosine(34) deaminase TadA [Bdellovibrionota bacterium]
MELDQRDEYWMARALEMAEKAKYLGEIPVGAVIISGDQLVAEAYNEKEQNADSTAHAEVLVIQRASKELKRWRLSECTMYVTLEPCLMCLGAVISSRVDRLVYGALDKKAGAVESIYKFAETTHFNHYPKLTSGVLADQSSQLIKNFFLELRNKKS